LFALAPEPGRVNFVPGFLAPPLPAAGAEGLAAARASAQALADRLGVGRGAAVDFWTEAALFSAAGATALVFGPGDIAQAHTAGEWVALAELSACAEVYRRMWS
jgi:acetylornithine deacetylase